MAPSGGTCTILSVPEGCKFYLLNYSTGALTETALPYTAVSFQFVIKDENGNNVTAKCIPEGTIEPTTVAFRLTMFINQDMKLYNIPYYNAEADGSGNYDFIYGGIFNTSENNSIGNIPMGELTFNGVQSVTYNGTDYTKLVVDGTNYPIVMISFTIAGTTYQAEEGMTWGEWIESSYNTSGYYLSGTNIQNRSSGLFVCSTDKSILITVQEMILEGTAYYELARGHMGGTEN